MTATALAPSRPSSPSVRKLFVRAAAGSVFGVVATGAIVWPTLHARGLIRVPPIHPHPPQLWRMAAAGPVIQLHLAGVAVAILIGLVLLTGVKGTLTHRLLGWTWVLAMMTVAASSLFIRMINPGHFSFIHLLSGWTLIAAPMGVIFARRRKVRMHARMMTGLFTSGLFIAGLFAFMPGRLMWNLFFG
jgi:uncharacterized membrane protein